MNPVIANAPAASQANDLTRYQQIVESLPLLVWSARTDGDWDYLSPQWTAYTGFSVGDLLGEGWIATIHAEDRQPVMLAWQRAVAAGQRFECYFRLRRADGCYRRFKTTAVPSPAHQTNDLKWFGTTIDIDGGKPVEKTLLNQQSHDHSVVNSLSAPIAILDRDGNITDVNGAWREFARDNAKNRGACSDVGATYSHVCRSSQSESSQDAATVRAGIAAVLSGDADNFAFEYPCHCETEQRWFLMTASRIESVRSGAVVSHRNITARMQVEQRLRIAEAAIEKSKIGILQIRESGEIEYANDYACETLGYSRAELSGTDLRTVAVAGHAGNWPARWDYLKTKVTEKFEGRHRRKDGSTYPVAVTGTYIGVGDSAYVFSFFEDISERHAIESALRESEEKFRAVIEQAGDAFFLFGAAGNVLDAHRQAEELLGYTRQELRSLRPWQFVVGTDGSSTLTYLAQMTSVQPVNPESTVPRK